MPSHIAKHYTQDDVSILGKTLDLGVDYSDINLAIETLPVVIELRQKKVVAKVAIVRLYVQCSLLTTHSSRILPVHPIIIQHLRNIYPQARLPPYEDKTPLYLSHADPFLNIIQSHDEEVGTYFCGYRYHRNDIRLDPRIHFKDGNEYYVTELLSRAILYNIDRRKYDEEVLTLIVPYLKRGYYLPR